MSGYEPSPDATTVDPRLADRWRRALALVIDIFGVCVVGFMGLMVIELVADLDDPTPSAIAYCWLAGLFLLHDPVLMCRAGARNGQTFGRQALGVRVVTREGRPIGFWRAARRTWLGSYLIAFFTVGLYWIADYATGLISDRRQTLHDHIGGTFVFRADVDVERMPQGPLPADERPFESDQWAPPGYSAPMPPAPTAWPPPQRQNDDAYRAFGS